MRFKQDDVTLSPFVGSLVLDGCPATPSSAINTVRNGTLAEHEHATIGKALDGAFQNGIWKTYNTATDETIIEFDGAIGGPALWFIGVYSNRSTLVPVKLQFTLSQNDPSLFQLRFVGLQGVMLRDIGVFLSQVVFAKSERTPAVVPG
jgi:hypothetical protein